MAAPNGVRYVRIVVDTEHSRALIVKQLAHELWHVLEIADAPDVVDADSLRALYRRIGRPSVRPDLFETDAAIQVTAAVAAECR
jgi:hypothetical protein